MARRPTRTQKPRKKSGIWRGIILLCLGFTAGLGAAAWIASTINKLPLPFTSPPTRDDLDGGNNLKRSRREALEFHETLQQQQEPAAFERTDEKPQARGFVYYLQLGAYSSSDLAEQLRGQIALLGEQALLRPSSSSSGEEIFRVWLGPYTNRKTAESKRADLALQGYDEIQLLKLAEKQ